MTSSTDNPFVVIMLVLIIIGVLQSVVLRVFVFR